jgi:nucleotide-binding universal stress UspA family protein
VATGDLIAVLREAAGHRIIAVAREAFSDSDIPVTGEVVFGTPAETICQIAQERDCTGIVIGRSGFEPRDLLRGSVSANVLRLATVPVTIVSARVSTAVKHEEKKSSLGSLPLALSA